MPHVKFRPTFDLDQARLDELRNIVPEAFADGKINWETLRVALGQQLEEEGETSEHFGLNWPGKRKARQLAFSPSTGTLVPAKGEGINEDRTENIFIEGENLEVLKLLQKSYAGKIKLIYIDPPYNTNGDQVYNDSFVDPLSEYLKFTGLADEEGRALTTNTRSDGRFHSRWLNMMYPRLKLSRNLLPDDGCILVHIDENECEHLRLLLNEVYGEENFLGQIIWDKRNPKGDATGIAYQHETISIYAKNRASFLAANQCTRPKKNAVKILAKAKQLFSRLGKEAIPDDLQICAKKYNIPKTILNEHLRPYTLERINDEFATWMREQDFSGGEKAYCHIDDAGGVYQSVSMAWPNKKKAPADYFRPLIHPKTKRPCPVPARGWRNPPTTMEALLAKAEILFGSDETTQPRRKYLLKNNMFENVASLLYYGGSDDALLKELGIPFENPKPVEVAKQLVSAFIEPGDIVLDFFAGSCTAAHAVLELGEERDAEFQFICVQIPEVLSDGKNEKYRTIAELGKDRIRKVIKKNKMSAGFRSFKLNVSHFRAWQDYHGSDVRELEDLFDGHKDPLCENWKKRDLLTEILLHEGAPLTAPVCKETSAKKNDILSVEFDGRRLLICLDEKLYAESLSALSLKESDTFICLDSALTDQQKLRLSDQGLLKTI